MLLDINSHSGVPIYRQLLEQIKRRIMAGQLPPGDKLPAVRQLAADLKVNPMTISKVYSFLEHEGFALRQRGIGLFVAELSPGQKEGHTCEILSDSVRKTVSLARELQLSKEQTLEMIAALFDEHAGTSLSDKNTKEIIP
jgi:GntR family transcriptional regulator